MDIAGGAAGDLDGIFAYVEANRQRDGAIHIPKETGMFLSQK